jgi:heterodisulfide reductase subunit A2
MSNVKVGVFICDCGDQIASILDMETLEKATRALPGVAIARRLCRACSPDGLAAIQSAIAEEGLDRVLVAGCPPRTLEPRFRAACEEAGLNGDLFELVDIREGCAWVHQDEPAAATAKAVDLIRMGVAKDVLRQARQPVSAEIAPAALVVGGGVAGMTAALSLASAGLPVKLVERGAALGGMLRDAHTLYPDRRSAADFVAAKAQAVTHHPRINVLLESEIADITGTVGRYTVHVNGSDRHNGSSTFDVGAIVVATGARTLQPWGLFRYDGKRVVTQLEFERELQDAETSDVVMILCAGQRDETIPYCSGVCCMGALKQAMEVKAANPEANVTILFRDLYLLGEGIHENQVIETRQAGVEFIRYAPSSPPVVGEKAVQVHDELTGTERRLPYDRVVLATPLVPQPDASVVAHALGITQDANGFFPEMRHRLRPQNYAERGIYICGAAHSPTGWIEAEFQAASAAFKALRHLRTDRVTSHAPVAVVDETLCTGCGNCVETCAFDAISMRKREGVLDLSQVDPLLCKGCGNCVVACPVKAINLPLDSDAQVLAQIDAALSSAPQNGRSRILAFGCEWSGQAAAESAGANKLSYPADVRLIRVGCSARLDPMHVLWAFFSGADGVFLGACPPGDCHYVNGNRYAQGRINTLRGLLTGNGFDPRRLRLEWITPDDPRDFVDKITDFTNLVQALG